MTKREIIGISVLLVVISVYLADQLLYQPLKLNKTRIANEQLRIIQELEEIDAQQSRGQNLLVQEPQIKKEYQKIITQIPFEPMISDTVRYLEWSAVQAKVTVDSCAIEDMQDKPKVHGWNGEPGSDNGALTPFRLKVIARGSRCHLLCFLLQIDKSPRLMIIEDLSWSVGEPKDGIMPPSPGSNGFGETEKIKDRMNDVETETITITLTIYCNNFRENTSQ